MADLLKLPLFIAKFTYLSAKSHFNRPIDKLYIFITLLVLWFKKIFERKDNKIKSHNIFGFKVYGFSYEAIGFLFQEVFVEGDYFFEHSNNSPQIIDCGANIGMSILYFKKLYPKCKIIAFEPNPFTFELLCKNMTENNLTDVSLYNVALANNVEPLDFYLSDDLGTLHGSLFTGRGGEKKYTVQTARLSSFITDEIDVVKIDVEGAESQILADLQANRKLPLPSKYLLEYHHLMNKSDIPHLSDFLKPFEETGYSYNIRTKYKYLGQFQDIFIHFFLRK
ncbi:FkbM family methyltransferase [Spirosoma gilvum]